MCWRECVIPVRWVAAFFVCPFSHSLSRPPCHSSSPLPPLPRHTQILKQQAEAGPAPQHASSASQTSPTAERAQHAHASSSSSHSSASHANSHASHAASHASAAPPAPAPAAVATVLDRDTREKRLPW